MSLLLRVLIVQSHCSARLRLKKLDMLFVDTEGNDPAVLWGARAALESGMINVVEYEHQ